MNRMLGLMLFIALIAVPATAQKVTVDYAHDFDFDSVETFQYVDTTESNVDNSMMGDRIAAMIRQKLVEGGLKEVDSNPDIYVTYHSTSEENVRFNTTNFGYGGAWGGWGGYGRYGYPYGGGISSSSTTATTYEVGTLLIDAYDAAEKKMIWRGTGTVTVKSKPEKQIKQVENILTKIGKKWRKILAGQGK
jgi:hypothetical protein